MTPEPSLPGTITSVFAISAHGAVSDAIRMALLAASRVMVIPVPCSKMVLTEGKTVAGVISPLGSMNAKSWSAAVALASSLQRPRLSESH